MKSANPRNESGRALPDTFCPSTWETSNTSPRRAQTASLPPIHNGNAQPHNKCRAPRHIVAIQLKTLTPVGTEISIVAYIKNNSLDTGMPVANIRCAQTINDRNAIAATAYTIEL